jgi:hypothetical protein
MLKGLSLSSLPREKIAGKSDKSYAEINIEFFRFDMCEGYLV